MKSKINNRLLLSSLFLILYTTSNSQNIDKEIEEVVITGQYSQQSLDKSIYQVEIISQEDIKNRAASTISDILSYNLNFITTTNSSTGDSEASLFGLDNQYFKVLIDNIPLVSDNGMGKSVDLTKINLDDVERIEIVRGSMGVDYGSNSFTGLINIITKKKMAAKWKIAGYVQEESVGKEYDWKEQGKHIQSLSISHNISDHWFISLGANRNDFNGFFGKKKGKRYYENDGKRGYEWLPKEQWNMNGMISYNTKKFSAFYKAQYLNELIQYYDAVVDWKSLTPGGLYTYSSKDRDYKTDRWINHLFLNTKLFDRVDYTGDFSYQEQNRKKRDYIYDIGKRNIFEKDPYKTLASTKAWYSRGTFSNFFNAKTFDFQLGYEFTLTEGFRSADSNSTVGLSAIGFDKDINKHLDNYDVFASGEIHTNSDLSLRPGFRASFNSKFNDLYSYSLALKYKLGNNSDIRAEFASSNRTPNFDELYTYFVNINHDISGNKDLTPEKGYSTSIHWNKKFISEKDFKVEVNLNTLYIELQDKIELATVSILPLKYKYLNVDKYKTWGLQMGSSFSYNMLNFNLGASYFGVSRILKDEINGIPVITPDSDYLYTFQLNSDLNYTIKKWGTTISLYYKYNGKESSYILDSNSEAYFLGKQDDFSLLDMSVRKSLFNKVIELTVGVRNIFDVKRINTTAVQSSAHGGATSSINLFYGRSYFAKLGFNFNI